MKIVCAQCNVTLGEREPFDEDSISHGICLRCKDKILKKLIENKVEEKAAENKKGKENDYEKRS